MEEDAQRTAGERRSEAQAKALFQPNRTISPDELSRSKREDLSNSGKSASNNSGNTPGNNMQRYFKIPNGHLFSFQKEFMQFGFRGAKPGARETGLGLSTRAGPAKGACSLEGGHVNAELCRERQSRADSEKLKRQKSSGSGSILSKSTQNLSSVIKEETHDWEDEVETPRKSLARDCTPYEKLEDSGSKCVELELSSSGSELDFLKESREREAKLKAEAETEEPRGDLEEVIKCASNLTRNRRDQFFQSLNSISLADTLDREEEPGLYERPPGPEEEFCEGEGFLFKKAPRSRAQATGAQKERGTEATKKKRVREDFLDRHSGTRELPLEVDLYSPRKAAPEKESQPKTPLRKKKSFRDFLRTKKKKKEIERVITIDLRPESRAEPKPQPKSKAPRDFSEKIKAWNQMARAGAGVR